MKASELAARAADMIEDLGWARGDFQTPDGVCALGAMNMARYGAAEPYLAPEIHPFADGFEIEQADACPEGYEVSKLILDTWRDENPNQWDNYPDTLWSLNDAHFDKSKAVEAFRRASRELEAAGR